MTTAHFPTSIAPDGHLIIWQTDSSNNEVSTVALGEAASADGHNAMASLIHAPSEDAEVAPDGHWIAYESNESGQYEVYVRPYPRVDDGQVLISDGGGTRPLWARNGKELFYVDRDGFLTAVPIQTSGGIFKAT